MTNSTARRLPTFARRSITTDSVPPGFVAVTDRDVVVSLHDTLIQAQFACALDCGAVDVHLSSREVTVEAFERETVRTSTEPDECSSSAVVTVKTRGLLGFADAVRKYSATFRIVDGFAVCDLLQLGTDLAATGRGEDRETALAEALNTL